MDHLLLLVEFDLSWWTLLSQPRYLQSVPVISICSPELSFTGSILQRASAFWDRQEINALWGVGSAWRCGPIVHDSTYSSKKLLHSSRFLAYLCYPELSRRIFNLQPHSSELDCVTEHENHRDKVSCLETPRGRDQGCRQEKLEGQIVVYPGAAPKAKIF